jgi:hypothetical protein
MRWEIGHGKAPLDNSGCDAACELPQVNVTCADVHRSTGRYYEHVNKQMK